MDDTPNIDVPGWSELIDWFGYSPNFHDAEILSIDLRREPEVSTIRIHVWRTNDDVTPEGFYRLDRHAIATFSLWGIRSLQMEGWNHQNALWELRIDSGAEGFTLHMPTANGLEGEIVAARISVAIEAYSPPTA